MNSGSNSSLSQYEMSAEMKGYYQHENLNPHRSSRGSNSMITSMTSGVGVNRPPQRSFNPTTYSNVYKSMPTKM